MSCGTVSRIRGRFRPERQASRTSLLREAADGIRLVRRHPLLRAVMIQAPLVNFAFTGVIFTVTLALRRHGTAPGIIGLAQAGIAVGGLIGALIAPRLQGRLSLSRLVIVLAVSATALFAAMLRAAPEDMRGRVTNTVILGATGLAALAPLTAGLLVQHFSGTVAMLAFAAVMAVAAVMSMTLRGLREAEAEAAAHTAGAPPP